MRPVLLIYERVTTPTALPKPAPPVLTSPVPEKSSGSPTLPIVNIEPIPNADTKLATFGSPSLIPNTSPDFIPFTNELYFDFLTNIKNVSVNNERLQVINIFYQNVEIDLKINNRSIKYTLINDVYKSNTQNFKISELHLDPVYNFIMMTQIDFVNITNVTKQTEYFGTINIDYIILVEPQSQVNIYFLWSIPTSFINTWVDKNGDFYQGKKKLNNYFTDKTTIPIPFFNLDITKSYQILNNCSSFLLFDDQNNQYICFSLKKFFSNTVQKQIVKLFKNDVDTILKKIQPDVETVICQEDMLLVFLNIDDLKLTAALNKGQPLYSYLYNALNEYSRLEFTNILNELLYEYDDCAYYEKKETDNLLFGVLKLKAGDVINYNLIDKGHNIQMQYTLRSNIYYYPSLKYNMVGDSLYLPCLIMKSDDYDFFKNSIKYDNETYIEVLHYNTNTCTLHVFDAFKFFQLTQWIANEFQNEDYCLIFKNTTIFKKGSNLTDVEVGNFCLMMTVKKTTEEKYTKENFKTIFFVRYTDIDLKSYEYIAFPIVFKIIVTNDIFLKKVDNSQPPEYFENNDFIILTYDYKTFLQKIHNNFFYYNNLINDLPNVNDDVKKEFIEYIIICKDILS